MGIEISRARLADVPGIVALVDQFAKRGDILPRSPEDIYQTVREWAVAREDERIVACGSLVILWADLAEIRSLVVDPRMQGLGIGRKLVDRLMLEAAELDIPQAFALTREIDFFLKVGFHEVPRDNLPRKIWKDCMHCTKFVGCDEVAMIQAVDDVTLAPDGEYRIQMMAPLVGPVLSR